MDTDVFSFCFCYQWRQYYIFYNACSTCKFFQKLLSVFSSNLPEELLIFDLTRLFHAKTKLLKVSLMYVRTKSKYYLAFKVYNHVFMLLPGKTTTYSKFYCTFPIDFDLRMMFVICRWFVSIACVHTFQSSEKW